VAHTQAQAQAVQAENARIELAEYERRRDSYELRLTRELPTPVDADELMARHRALEVELAAARRLEVTRQQWREEQARHRALSTQRSEAAGRAAELEAQVAARALPDELVASWHELTELQEARDAEAALVAELRTQLAGARALAELAAQRALDATSFSERRQVHTDRARVAAYTKNVLQGVHATLSGELRPGLEGALCELLTRLSEGRFSAARLDEDYEVSVLDDGAYRPLSELSGGEADLVALCLRLALASVVAERHGSDALGLLILDEVFGSQDASRRESILTALRELRSLYGQVLLISHVGGIEDAADKVVELRCGADRRLAEVSVL
jgi:exonuclease SbcC